MARAFVQVRAEAKLAWIMPNAAESLKEKKRTFKKYNPILKISCYEQETISRPCGQSTPYQ